MKHEWIHTINVSKTKILGVTAIIAFLSIGSLGIANAELKQVNIPFPGPYMEECGFSIEEFLIFNCIWRSDRVPESVREEIRNIQNRSSVGLPPDEIQAGIDRIIIEWMYPPELEPEPEPPKPTVREILIEKLPIPIQEAVERLAQCQYGFEGWAAIQQQSYYEIPDQMIAFDGKLRTEVLIKRLNMAYQACEAQRNYQLSPTYEHFVEADLLGLDRFGREQTQFFNQTTNVGKYYYDPLTQEDFDAAEQKALDFMCSDKGKRLGHCVVESTDINRGNPNPIIKNIDQYNQYINFKAGQIQSEQDYLDTIAAAKEAQCTVHYPIYKHRVGRTDTGGQDLPVWLEHCESASERFQRVGAEGQRDMDLMIEVRP